MNTINEIPRRIILTHNTPAEIAIQNAIWEVEKVGASVELTNIIISLGELKNRLSDEIESNFKDLIQFDLPI